MAVKGSAITAGRVVSAVHIGDAFTGWLYCLSQSIIVPGISQVCSVGDVLGLYPPPKKNFR